MRPAELFHLKGDSSKAEKEIGWSPKVCFKELIVNMVREDLKRLK